MTRQRLGQHFLGDPAWREQIARAIRVSPHSLSPVSNNSDKAYCWIEIGAGHGEMTTHLAATGAPVYAIELEAGFARGLKPLAERLPNVTVVPGDVLKTDFVKLAGGRRVHIYGNLPYYITSPILHHVFDVADIVDEMHMVIQSEVAERLTAEPGTKDYGYLTVVTRLHARPELVFRIPRGAFLPPPDVRSALVTLRFPGEPIDVKAEKREEFLKFVKACFSQKRKTLVNSLKSTVPRNSLREAMTAMKLRPDARAEQLSLAELAGLWKRNQE
jgi:16S rRNA (adenine1518-N6/adenine1519-N6)-dimethyltransferase